MFVEGFVHVGTSRERIDKKWHVEVKVVPKEG